MKIYRCITLVVIFSFTALSPVNANQIKAESVTSDSTPIIFSRHLHTNYGHLSLGREKFQILASMYFWQADSKKLAIFNSDLSTVSAVSTYPFTPLSVTRAGTFYTIGGKCTAPFPGMSACPDVIGEKIGSSSSKILPSPRLLDNHELEVDSNGDFWAIRYLDYPSAYFSEFFSNSRSSALIKEFSNVDRVSDCEIIKFDRNGKISFRWSALMELPPSEIRDLVWQKNPTGVVKEGSDGMVYADLFHCNSIDTHPSGKKFLISARHTDSVYEIDITSKQVTWKIGGNNLAGKSLKILNQKSKVISSNSFLGGQHDARYVGKDEISIFDNSTNYDRAARGLLLKLDLNNRKAILMNVFSDPNGQNSGCTGSFREVKGTYRWFVAGWGCSRSGLTVFASSGKAIVSLEIADDTQNDPFRPAIPIVNTESMISYRVTPHIFQESLQISPNS